MGSVSTITDSLTRYVLRECEDIGAYSSAPATSVNFPSITRMAVNKDPGNPGVFTPYGSEPGFLFAGGTNTEIARNIAFSTCSDALILTGSTGTLTQGGTMNISANLNLPDGGVPVHDVYQAFQLIPGFSYNGPSSANSQSLLGTGTLLSPVQAYACKVPELADSALTLSDFQQALADGKCVPWGGTGNMATSVLISTEEGYTHVVSYAPSYAINYPYGTFVPNNTSVSLTVRRTNVACGTVGQSVIRSYASVKSVLNPTVDLTSNQVHFINEAVTANPAQTLGPWKNNSAITSVRKGETFTYRLSYSSNNTLNPTSEVTIPSGLRLLETRFVRPANAPNVCVSPTLEVVQIASNVIRITPLNPDGGDLYYTSATTCGTTTCNPAFRGTIELDFYVELDSPYGDGHVFTTQVKPNSSNSSVANPAVVTSNLQLKVPAEMGLLIEPTCSADTGAGRQLGVRTTLSNNGGLPLSDVHSIIEIPKQGDGLGTEADTFFDSYEAPAGVTLECSVDGGLTYAECPPTKTAVTHVKILAPNLAPYSNVVVRIFFSVGGAVPEGASIYVRGSMDTDLLLPITASSVAPSRVGLCPGELMVNSCFDTNGNGIRDTDEFAIMNWVDTNNNGLRDEDDGYLVLELTIPGSIQVIEVPIASDGTASIALPGGSAGSPAEYTWTLRNPITGDAVWTYTVQPPPTVSMVADQITTLNLPMTCVCPSDNNVCTTDTCNALGECRYVAVQPLNIPDDTCDNIDDDCDGRTDEDYVPLQTTCGVGVCANVGVSTCVNGVEDSTVGTCVVNSAAASAEVCDGLDNDCDGQTDGADADLVLVNCENQAGVCAGSQKPSSLCVNATWGACDDTIYAAHDTRYSTTDAICDGVDNNCSGVADEGYVAQVTSCGQGVCASTGVSTCVNGVEDSTVGTCVVNSAAASAEVCDGLDNDCDGQTDGADQDLVLVACEKQSGVCQGAYKTAELCVNSAWIPCDEAFYAAHDPRYSPTNETCDGVDNNCTGTRDEEYVAIQTTCGLGVCANVGLSTCIDGVEDPNIGTCVVNNDARGAEVCDGLDNDCDGETDAVDADLVIVDCEKQEGVCQGLQKPVTLCLNGAWQDCSDAEYVAYNANYSPTDASCDNLDNNCDGQIDEAFEVVETSCGVGACANTIGAIVCEQGVTRDTCDPLANASAEVCDGIDNNCDGETDELFGNLAESCTVGLGACQQTSTYICAADGSGTVCDVQEILPSEEICDGIDNDCDGEVDEDGACDVDTTISAHPDAVTSETSATFNYFDPLNPGATTFECRVNDGEWFNCDNGSMTVTDLEDGTPTFEVRSVGVDGRRDDTPAKWEWVVNTVDPDTTIESAPQTLSQQSDAEFTFGSNVENPSAWWCALDPQNVPPLAEDYVACDESWTFEDLGEGDHTLWVYVVDEYGTPDTTPATYEWTVDTTAPDTSLTSTTAGLVCAEALTFTFTGEEGSSFVCRLDGGEWQPCESGFTVETLADGSHTFEVAAIDAAGNQDPSPASVSFDFSNEAKACDACQVEGELVDANGDGIDDRCQDRDHDGIPDASDNCPSVANPAQEDEDNDGFGNACDGEPWEDIIAEGDGNCSSSQGGWLGLSLLALAGMVLRRRQLNV